MQMGLEGKSVFVAAASKGLGKATALAYAREGAKVTIASRNVAELEKARSEIREATGQTVSLVRMDVLSEGDIVEAIRYAAAEHGGLDVLVTNAGGPRAGVFANMSDEDWDKGYTQNLLSVVRLIRESLPYMRAAGGGRIVNLASTSVKQPIEGLILSNVFRAGVQALAKSLASELAPEGILINNVAPGRIATDRIAELDGLKAQELGVEVEEVQARNLSLIPMGRLGTPEEFARVAVFYGSFANSYITGQTVLVDGGMVKSIS